VSLPTNSLPMYSRISEQLTNVLSSTRYPPAAPISVVAQGTSQAAKNARTLPNEFPGYEIRSYLQQRNYCTNHCTSLIPSTGLPIELQFLHSLMMSAPLLSNSAITSYQLAFGTPMRLRLIPYLICTSATLGQIGVTNSSLATSKTHPLQPPFDAPS
jgi:hypothetical protein